MHNDPLRQSGRTTRMLEHAVAQAKKRKHVIVYCATPRHMRHVSQVLSNMLVGGNEAARISVNVHRGIQVSMYDGGSITVEVIEPDFNWVTLRGAFVPAEVACLVDHYAIERRYPAATEMLYRFIAQ